MEWPSNRRDPWRFLINERKHTFVMACTVLVLRDNMPWEFKIFIATFLMNLVVRELPREHRVAGVLRRHVVPRWGGGGEGRGDQSFLWHSKVQVEHLQHLSSPAVDDGSIEANASDSSRFRL
jgi:hypothetical protein